MLLLNLNLKAIWRHQSCIPFTFSLNKSTWMALTASASITVKGTESFKLYPWLRSVGRLSEGSCFLFTKLWFSVAQPGKFWMWQHQEMFASLVPYASLTPCSWVFTLCVCVCVCSHTVYVCVFVRQGCWNSSRWGEKQDVKSITRWTLDTKGTSFE